VRSLCPPESYVRFAPVSYTTRSHTDMSGPVFIDGDRIDLRTVEEEDIEFLVRGVNHPDVRRYISVFRLPQNTERYGETFENIDSSDSGATLLIHADGEPVGSVQLYPIDDSRGWANLGCWIGPEQQGNGYATEACERIVAYGFRELRLHRISGVVMTPNVASSRRPAAKRSPCFCLLFSASCLSRSCSRSSPA